MPTFCYHVHNAAKARVLLALFENYPKALTTYDIAQATNMDYANVRRLLTNYSHSYTHYITRLKKKGENGAFRYLINKKGFEYLTQYIMRIRLGISLGLKKRHKIKYMSTYKGHRSVRVKNRSDYCFTVDEIAPYIQIKKRGYENGITQEDKLKRVGIVKDEAGEGKETVRVKRKMGRPRKNPVDPSEKKAKAKRPDKQEKLSETPVKKPVKQEKTAKSDEKRQGKETSKQTKKYLVIDFDVDELEYPEKTYTTASGDTYTSRKAAKQFVAGLNDIQDRMRFTFDKNNLKKLQNEKRDLLVFLRKSPDILQYIIYQ